LSVLLAPHPQRRTPTRIKANIFFIQTSDADFQSNADAVNGLLVAIKKVVAKNLLAKSLKKFFGTRLD